MDKIYLGRRLSEFSPGIASKPISKVELLDENGDVVGVSGSGTGRTLTALQPDGTNAMAAAILAKVSGYKHIGYEGSEALLDPAVELGDAVTVDGLYVPLIAMDMTFDPMLAPNISAPDADEIDDEYPYKSPTQRQIERNMAKTRSLITKTSEEIMLKVEGVDGRVTSLSTSINGIEANISSLDGSITNIKVDVNSLRTTVSGKIDSSTAQSLIDQSINKIELSVSSGSSGSTFTLKAGSTTLSTKTLDLHVDAVNIEGTLKANQIQTGSIYVGDLADGSSYATKTYVQNNAGLNESEVNSAIATYIDKTSITAETLRGRYIDLLASNNSAVGSIELVYTTTGYGMAITTNNGGIKLQSGGNIYMESSNGTFVQITDSVYLGGGTLRIGSGMYGSRLPSNPEYGQLFFLRN